MARPILALLKQLKHGIFTGFEKNSLYHRRIVLVSSVVACSSPAAPGGGGHQAPSAKENDTMEAMDVLFNTSKEFALTQHR